MHALILPNNQRQTTHTTRRLWLWHTSAHQLPILTKKAENAAHNKNTRKKKKASPRRLLWHFFLSSLDLCFIVVFQSAFLNRKRQESQDKARLVSVRRTPCVVSIAYPCVFTSQLFFFYSREFLFYFIYFIRLFLTMPSLNLCLFFSCFNYIRLIALWDAQWLLVCFIKSFWTNFALFSLVFFLTMPWLNFSCFTHGNVFI